jgi:hypothetical protein
MGHLNVHLYLMYLDSRNCSRDHPFGVKSTGCAVIVLHIMGLPDLALIVRDIGPIAIYWIW